MSNSNSRSKLFIENFIIYGFGSALGLLIPFIMLPILTRIYPNAEYIGLYDSVNVLVFFASYVGILGIADIMFRYFFEEEGDRYRKKVTSTALFTLIPSGLIVAIIVAILRKPLANLILGDPGYSNLVLIASVTIYFTVINAVIAAPTRMRNQRGRYLTVNICSSLASYSIVLPLLFIGWYETAMPIALMCSMILTVTSFMIMNRHDFSLSAVDREMCVKLLKLSLPSMPSYLFYWVISSAQLIFITNIRGIEETGIYSVGSKMASVSQLINTAFGVGWSFFVFSTMKDKDHTEMISKVFDYLSGISFFLVCVVVMLSQSVFVLLFEAEYAEGKWVMPVLFLAPLIMMLYQSITSQYTVIKKTYVGPCCLAAGACICVLLDILLIPVIGLRGAAVANLSGFTVALCLMAFLLRRRKLIILRGRILCCALAAYISLAVFVMKAHALVYYTVSGAGALFVLLLYYKEGFMLLKGIMDTFRKKLEGGFKWR